MESDVTSVSFGSVSLKNIPIHLPMDCIQLESVSKAFNKKPAVNHLSLNIPSGCVYGFIGPNGSGKTTTLRMILNIIYPDSGNIRLFGKPYQHTLRNRIGYLPEERGLYQKMKVKELIEFFGGIKGYNASKKEIMSWLERFELDAYANKKVDVLSKGMSQKVQFISTIISKPELLILDEPFSGLDPVNTEVVQDAIVDLQKNGTTVVFSTHDMATAERMCDRIFMIYQGNKVLDGTLQEIQGQYGADTINLRLGENTIDLESLNNVKKVKDYGQQQELKLEPGSDPQQILQQLVGNVQIERFEISKPSLHDIFVRIVAPDSATLEETTEIPTEN